MAAACFRLFRLGPGKCKQCAQSASPSHIQEIPTRAKNLADGWKRLELSVEVWFDAPNIRTYLRDTVGNSVAAFAAESGTKAWGANQPCNNNDPTTLDEFLDMAIDECEAAIEGFNPTPEWVDSVVRKAERRANEYNKAQNKYAAEARLEGGGSRTSAPARLRQTTIDKHREAPAKLEDKSRAGGKSAKKPAPPAVATRSKSAKSAKPAAVARPRSKAAPGRLNEALTSERYKHHEAEVELAAKHRQAQDLLDDERREAQASLATKHQQAQDLLDAKYRVAQAKLDASKRGAPAKSGAVRPVPRGSPKDKNPVFKPDFRGRK